MGLDQSNETQLLRITFLRALTAGTSPDYQKRSVFQSTDKSFMIPFRRLSGSFGHLKIENRTIFEY